LTLDSKSSSNFLYFEEKAHQTQYFKNQKHTKSIPKEIKVKIETRIMSRQVSLKVSIPGNFAQKSTPMATNNMLKNGVEQFLLIS